VLYPFTSIKEAYRPACGVKSAIGRKETSIRYLWFSTSDAACLCMLCRLRQFGHKQINHVHVGLIVGHSSDFGAHNWPLLESEKKPRDVHTLRRKLFTCMKTKCLVNNVYAHFAVLSYFMFWPSNETYLFTYLALSSSATPQNNATINWKT